MERSAGSTRVKSKSMVSRSVSVGNAGRSLSSPAMPSAVAAAASLASASIAFTTMRFSMKVATPTTSATTKAAERAEPGAKGETCREHSTLR